LITFKHKNWENSLEISPENISIVAVESPKRLWEYCNDLINQTSGESGGFLVFKSYQEQPFDKFISAEISVPSLTLNTKKLQTALIKKCAELSVSPDYEERLRTVSLRLFNFCKEVCQDIGYTTELSEDIDLPALFKLFSLGFKEEYISFSEKLVEYVNACTEFLKPRIFVFLFLTKFLTIEELSAFCEHCRYQGISLILIEDSFPQGLSESINVLYKGIIIDKDDCEILKNFKNILQ